MAKSGLFRVLLVSTSGWLLTLGCGSRTGLPPGHVLGAAGSEGGAGAPAEPACNSDADCPQPPPGQCGTATCTDGACALELGPICNDGDRCTVDSCTPNGCMFLDGRVDADGDGVFASGTTADPKAALGCGKDCDDTSPDIFPGAIELCDALDNDCNGVVDDGAQLQLASAAPTRVSPLDADHSGPAGLAFDGESFGASMTTYRSHDLPSQGQFQQLTARGQLVGGPQVIARVNADSYGGALAWSGERYLTAYQDARQAGNYEIYFDLLNRKGERLIKDLRVTTADDYSMRPSVVWTGAEGLMVWEDRRFEDSGGTSAILGQRVSLDGQQLGANVRLSPVGVPAENASVALSDAGVGVAFVTLAPNDTTSINFMTASRSLDAPSPLTNIPFENADAPTVTALDDEYVVTFDQFDGIKYGPSIFGVVVKDGVMGLPQSMTTGATYAEGNATVSYGDRFVMVWADTKDGNYQLYAQSFDKKLAPISPRIRLTTTKSDTHGAALASSDDGGLGVLYTDDNNGKPQTFFTRLDCTPAFQLK